MKKEVKTTPKCKNNNKPIVGTYHPEHYTHYLFFDLWSRVAQVNFLERIWR